MASKGFKDSKAPSSLTIIVQDSNGKEWGRQYATAKEFSTGSVGYNASGKVQNPDNPEARYQIGANFTLIGSKPEGK
ncbi:hypothetical protein FACS1894109_10900 [Spirochaetia bacterium]|nr:hypothetical protein FACS1894109_10900 [Spirochaetia bacterium]